MSGSSDINGMTLAPSKALPELPNGDGHPQVNNQVNVHADDSRPALGPPTPSKGTSAPIVTIDFGSSTPSSEADDRQETASPIQIDPGTSTSSLQDVVLDNPPPEHTIDTVMKEDTPSHSPRPSSPAATYHTYPAAPSSPVVPGASTQTPGRRSSTAMSTISQSSGSVISAVTVSLTSALELISSSREAKRSKDFLTSTQHALELTRSRQATPTRSREIFEPLRLACETRNERLQIASIDCIAKLISHSFFMETTPQIKTTSPLQSPRVPNTPPVIGQNVDQRLPFPDLITHTITACHTESTPSTVSLQIVKALLALVMSPSLLVHHSSLLKAVRTVYNIFLLSSDSESQAVAQGGLTQMVLHVFARCRIPSAINGDASFRSITPNLENADDDETTSPARSTNGSAAASLAGESSQLHAPPSMPDVERSSLQVSSGDTTSEASQGGETNGLETSVPEGISLVNNSTGIGETRPSQLPASAERPVLTLSSFENPNPHDQMGDGDLQTGVPKHVTTNDLFIKDAFLVFRALCKLTMKSLGTDSERDIKSHAMRSKLLSLHLVLTILTAHMPIFVEPSVAIPSGSSSETTPFLQATKQYICLSLSRNAVSPVPQVFELSVEIFWRVMSGMRTRLKKEIEVLLHEIFIPILEMRNSTIKQKSVVMGMFQRLCEDPQAVVELYLNYDCDRTALDNIYEHLMNIISRHSSTYLTILQGKSADLNSTSIKQAKFGVDVTSIPPSYSTAAVSAADDASTSVSESTLKLQSLECLVAVLRSLATWGTTTNGGISLEIRQNGSDDRLINASHPETAGLATPSLERLPDRISTPDSSDDPEKFESAKQRKTTLLEGIRRFNFKPKRGIQFLIENGFIRSKNPKDVAAFLLHADGLSKTMVGEYLGEGDDENVAIMHAFVDMLDFTNLPFVDALRLFLQSFRLPGEAQKIDRFMLKFAERYIAGNVHTSFANADTAYVLSYSTILLNTDAHNPQVKVRMSKADFIRNNRGINDGSDLPEEVLSPIYDEIVSNEIRMKDEAESSAGQVIPSQGLVNALANVGRDLQREAYVMQSLGMANRTEALFRNLSRTQRRGTPRPSEQFFSASHHVHVRPMFEVAWMSFLAGISGPMQDTDDLDVVLLCLEGFKHAIRIACFFDLDLERNAFMTTLAKFTFLNNLGEMKVKHMEAIKLLLELSTSDGVKDNLKGTWHEILSCVSQLERLQFISDGNEGVSATRKSQTQRKSQLHRSKKPVEELAHASRSTQITVSADMVFSWSEKLSGAAILDFVKALCDVSTEEIQSSGMSERPRLFSLQKLVEISYYNMNRIRIEWSGLWMILGEHFNQVCCHNNPSVAIFALDALRQLAKRFLEKEELPHFKFQKDFLKPFEYTMIHNSNPDVRELVLQCLHRLIQGQVENMRSGWRTMFGVFSAASKVPNLGVANYAFEIVTQLYNDQFAAIVRYGSFADLTVCLTDFSKVSKFQKISLLSINMLRSVIPTMLDTPDCSLKSGPDGGTNFATIDDPMIRFWFPVLFSFYDIIMNGEDLEVRRLALDSLFDALRAYGSTFSAEFWDMVCREILFPIFSVLRSQDLSRFSTQEDMSVWLSTTMIQALRELINLYTHYFETLERTLDGLLELLVVCICQENDTLARIGTSCFQQLLEQNVHKLSPQRWERVITTFVKLFKTTTPYQLLDESLRTDLEDVNVGEVTGAESPGPNIIPAPLSSDSGPRQNDISAAQRKQTFKQIIVKCVLQLLLIETTHELLQNDEVYSTIPPEHLLRLMAVLDQSYQFARDFNADEELRKGLWKAGFMKHLPNLLKQESSSAATLVKVLQRMYEDERVDREGGRGRISERLIPLCLGILKDFNGLRAAKQSKSIVTWSPIIAEVLQGFSNLADGDFDLYLSALYPLATDLLARDLTPEVREALRRVFLRVGIAKGITAEVHTE
ncbi:hypothetical protein DACRYDRAFT_20361 [Dacryopinax primogenitus]|uniref:SEC7 domain-containing protein n=1 Tax=Dacryopinax primogenitus (strain DJM 731) TaxID=1858805 RepID=M5GDQ4_DACPD|nr:uncharacterized protein DACRYDRAFT_20361 [Dacryopinax primogenitus]EJU04717.1 hypothetical protein DACRYDRAFT_20361 [Dacryopinax primogenitus]